MGTAVGVSAPTSQSLTGFLTERVPSGIDGAVIGVLIGAPLGLIVGSEISAGREYVFNRVGSAGHDTTIVIDWEDFISETTTSVTFRWEGKEQIVPKPATEIHIQGKKVRLLLPRSYLRR